MNIVNLIIKILSFKFTQNDILGFEKKHFIVGVLGTWIVGMGRYWDNPRATFLQHLGIGSIIYIFALSAFIWIIIVPYKLKNWSYFKVLTFVSLTSFPAILYAIPVEKFMTLEQAQSVNAWFLGVVALWRLSLLIRFLKIYDDLSFVQIFTVSFLPICLIINVLAFLNLEKIIFDIMAGIIEPSGNDTAYLIVLLLSRTSLYLIMPLIMLYAWGIYQRRRKRFIV